MAKDQVTANIHFQCLQDLLLTLEVQEVKHKATPPSLVLIWQGICFDSHAMTVTLTPDKLTEATDLTYFWNNKHSANLHDL